MDGNTLEKKGREQGVLCENDQLRCGDDRGDDDDQNEGGMTT